MTSCLGENIFRFIYIGELDPNDLENDAEVFLKVEDSRLWRIRLFSWMTNVKLNMVDFLGQYHVD